MGIRLRRAAAILGGFSVGVLSAAAPTGAVVEDPEVDSFAAYEYRVDPETGTVGVTVELAVTADKANRSLASGTYQYYFVGYSLLIPGESQDLTVTDDAGGELAFTVDESFEGVDVLEIEFARNIYYRQTANAVISFVLPPGTPRSDGLSRVNAAYVGFEAWVDPILEEAEIAVLTPKGYADDSFGSDLFRIEFVDDQTRYFSNNIDPENYWSIVSLRRNSALVSTDVVVDDHAFRVEAWPGDSAWADHVTTNIEEGLPELIDTVGLSWPLDNELTIMESYSPFLAGYGGWYDAADREIELGDALDDHLVFHELSHVWFNEELFRNRWITEGLADQFGAEIVESIGGDAPEMPRSSMIDAVAEPLNSWTSFTVDGETELWSYGASWTVTNEIVEIIGMDALGEVVQASANDEIAYLGDNEEAEPGRGSKDWRLYLDLIENRGDVDDDAVTDLFTNWVLRSTEVNELVDRGDARTAYQALEAAGDEWAPPLAVRNAMSEWQFSTATDLIADSQALLEERDELVDLIEEMNGTLPERLEQSYEAADTDLLAAAANLNEATETANRLNNTRLRADNAGNVLERIGSIGSDFDGELAQAVGSFAAGDDQAALAQASLIDDDIDGLATAGLVRLGGALVLAMTIGVVVVVMRRRKRTARSSSEPTPGTDQHGDPHADLHGGHEASPVSELEPAQ